MKQFCRRAGRRGGKVVHLSQSNPKTAPRRIPRYAAAIDASTDDEKIIIQF
jgi:hypothetical protein